MKMRFSGFILCLFAGVSSLTAGPTGGPEISSRQADMSFISAGKEWEYILTKGHSLETSVLYHMRFEDSVDVNGHTYSQFVNYEAIRYEDGLQGYGEVLPVESCYPASYYREEGETVYILMQANGLPATGDLDPQSDYTEAVLMDFSLQDGDVLPAGLFDKEVGVPLLHVRYVESGNAEPDPGRRYYGLYSVSDGGGQIDYRPIFGEGFGLTTGILPDVELEWTTGEFESFLLSVRQGEEIVYKDGKYDYLWGTDSVEAVEGILQAPELKDGMVCLPGTAIAIFDIAGRKVAEGVGEVAVSHLPQGMYVAQAGGKTLKFLAR